MAHAAPLLRMQGIRKAFGPTVALDGVDLEVAAGEVHALVGENGAGKSTLMKVLSGAVMPDAGRMELDGEAYRPTHPLEARRRGVAMIYQELSLAPHLSVMENVLLGMEPKRLGLLDRGELRRKARDALEELGRADIPLDAPAGSVSIASQQIVEIARAMAVRCRVVVLDEPTSSLAHDDVEHLFLLIDRLRASRYAVVYISHVLEEVQRVADRFTVLRDGRSVGGGDVAGTSTSEIIRLMVGREVGELYPRSERRAGDVLLEVEELAAHPRPLSAGFQLRAGEVLGIAGLMGAGRTELLRAIFGLEPVRRGKIRVGAVVGPASPARRWRQGVGLLSEDRKTEGLAMSLTVAENVTLSRLGGLGPFGLVLPGRQRAAAARWVERLKIRCLGPWQPLSDLSGGNQQRVAVARLLHHDVDVLLLDEPTRGIDVASKADIYRLIDDLATAGKGILVVSSYLPELLGVCDRIAVMCRGRLGPSRPARDVTEHDLMVEATGTGDAA
jgi:ribose transport system ATP-binding protein